MGESDQSDEDYTLDPGIAADWLAFTGQDQRPSTQNTASAQDGRADSARTPARGRDSPRHAQRGRLRRPRCNGRELHGRTSSGSSAADCVERSLETSPDFSLAAHLRRHGPEFNGSRPPTPLRSHSSASLRPGDCGLSTLPAAKLSDSDLRGFINRSPSGGSRYPGRPSQDSWPYQSAVASAAEPSHASNRHDSSLPRGPTSTHVLPPSLRRPGCPDSAPFMQPVPEAASSELS